MLNNLETGVDKAQTMLQRANRRIKDLLESGGEKGKFITIIVLLFMIMVLIVLIFSV